MYWLLAVVAGSAYYLYRKSVPIAPKPIEPLHGIDTPSGAFMYGRPSTAGSNYAVKPSRYVTGQGAQEVVGLPRVNPPTRNGVTSSQPFSGSS